MRHLLLILPALLVACGASPVQQGEDLNANDPVDGGTTDTDAGTTDTDAGATDAGATDPDAGSNVVTDLPDTPVQCSTGTHWTRGDRGSSAMHPGRACIECHASEWDAPKYSAAGTVYPTAHEPDDCNGIPSYTVTITAADGRKYTAKSNSAGNFYFRSSFAKPYTAKVTSASGMVREMKDAQTSGDCNLCHTQDGTTTVADGEDAPGRVVAP